jgi:hypothetical protein
MIDHKKKFIFIHIARTGGTSIETVITGKDWWLIDPQTKHISASMARRIYGDEIWKTYTKFSVVRNPWDRFVSMWATKWWHQASGLDENCSFDEFIRNIRPHPHELYKTIHCHEILNEDIDFVLRFEYLQQDFSCMLASIGADDMVLPSVEKRSHECYLKIYNDKQKQIIAELYETDILKFGYSF